MKKLLFLFLFLLSGTSFVTLTAQNNWLKKTDFGGGERDDASGFAIGTTGYILSGTDTGGYFSDMWAWNRNSDIWYKVAPYPGGQRIGTRGVSLNGFGYVLGGEKPASCFGPYKHRGAVCEGTFYGDIWRYYPDSNSWSVDTSFPGKARDFAVAIADPDDSTIYYGTGNDNDSVYLSDWWAYHTSTRAWTRLADFPGGQRDNAAGFLANGNIYVGTGNDNDPLNYASNDFWKYTPSSNSWTRIANIPGIPLRCASSFSLNNYGYVCLGVGDTTYTSAGWRYNPANNYWTPIANFPAGALADGVAFAIDSNGYIGTGSYDGNSYSQYLEYTFENALSIPTQKDPAALNLYPNPNNGLFTITLSHPELVSGSQTIIEVYNELGEQVLTEALRSALGDNLINISGQPSGVYFYRLSDSGKQVNTGKFIIAR